MSGFSGGLPISVLRMQYAAPATGATVTTTAGVQALLIDPAGTIATLTVVLPPSPVDGQDFVMASTQIITALTITGTIVGTLTTLALGGFARFIYSATAVKWLRAG